MEPLAIFLNGAFANIFILNLWQYFSMEPLTIFLLEYFKLNLWQFLKNVTFANIFQWNP
jgi:hypothetical protein